MDKPSGYGWITPHSARAKGMNSSSSISNFYCIGYKNKFEINEATGNYEKTKPK